MTVSAGGEAEEGSGRQAGTGQVSPRDNRRDGPKE